MHFLVLGAAGFVGRHIVAELIATGERVTVAGRNPVVLTRMFPMQQVLPLDLDKPLPSDLPARLAGVDVLVNAAGLLDGPALEAVHVSGPRALYAAALAAGIARIVLISAISARADVATGYARTKLAGEAVLRESSVPWTILRPSLIVAKGSFGGTSVIRGLAGLPLVTPLPADDAAFSPLHARDLGRVVLHIAGEAGFAGRTLEPSGPETLGLAEIVRQYRRWLGFAPAPVIRMPRWTMAGAGWLGDRLGGGPISSTSLAQLAAGNAGDGAAFAAEAGVAVRGLSTILAEEPADVQDRWHARLFFPRIGVRAVLILTWLASALTGLATGLPMATAFLTGLSLPDGLAPPLVIATSAIDFAVAAILLVPSWRRWATAAQLAVVIAYTLGLTLVMPSLWLDPFGALLKNLAVLALVAVDGLLAEAR